MPKQISKVTHANQSLDQRCLNILEYFYPNYKSEMTVKQFENSMDALRSIQQPEVAYSLN